MRNVAPEGPSPLPYTTTVLLVSSITTHTTSYYTSQADDVVATFVSVYISISVNFASAFNKFTFTVYFYIYTCLISTSVVLQVPILALTS